MHFLYWIIHTILNIQYYLKDLTIQYGGWIYLILFLIIFCETGLVIIPFLPGDSLLFIAGTLASNGINYLNFFNLFISTSIAAIAGDICNYFIGEFFGKKLIKHSNIRVLNKNNLQRTYDFYEKHGGKAIIISRFIPIIRTFAPFIAGIGHMKYIRFLTYNIIGGIAWTTIFLSIGYFLGYLSLIKNYTTEWSLFVIFISILIGIIQIKKQKK